MTWKCSDVRAAVESRGYQRIDSEQRKSALWYRSPASTEWVSQYLVLEHKPRADSYSVLFGFSCESARNQIRHIVEWLKQMRLIRSNPELEPCVLLFDAGRALHWGYLSIPDPVNRTLGPSQFGELCKSILHPVVEMTTSCAHVLDLLFQDNTPFEWGITNPVLRAAEIFAISGLVGHDIFAAKEKLQANKNKLLASMRVGSEWERALELIADRAVRIESSRLSQ